MNRARERRILIERQLADAETLPRLPRHGGCRDGYLGSSVKLTTAQQLEAEQARRCLTSSRYTPEHPDIKALEHSIADLQKKLADETRNPRPTRSPSS